LKNQALWGFAIPENLIFAKEVFYLSGKGGRRFAPGK